MKTLFLITSLLTMNVTENVNKGFTITTESNYHYEDCNYYVSGNYTSINEDQFCNDDNKIYIYYDFNLNDNVNNNKEYYNSNCSIYYYKNKILYKHLYNTNSINNNEIKADIEEFISKTLKNNANINKVANQNYYPIICSGTITNETKPYGYSVTRFGINKFRFNDETSLYFLNLDNEYVGGKAASKNLINGYNSWYNIKKGSMTIDVYQACLEDRDLVFKGGKPILKDVYPSNRINDVSITSSYGASLEMEISKKDGFYINGILQQGYSKQFNSTEPKFTYTTHPVETNRAIWSFNYNDHKESVIINYGYIYELNNRGHQLKEGDVSIGLSSSFNLTFDKESSYIKIVNLIDGKLNVY